MNAAMVKTYPCGICGREFTWVKGTEKHALSNGRLACPTCAAKAPRIDDALFAQMAIFKDTYMRGRSGDFFNDGLMHYARGRSLVDEESMLKTEVGRQKRDSFEEEVSRLDEEGARAFAIERYCSTAEPWAARFIRDLSPRGTEELPEPYRSMDEIVVYRGAWEPEDVVRDSLSWSLDVNVAYFSKMAGDCFGNERRLYAARIRPRDVISYVPSHGFMENSEVLQFRSVYDVTEIGI